MKDERLLLLMYLQKGHGWPGYRNGGFGGHTETKKVRIMSKNMNPEELNKTARAHWGIENSLHWRLDVVFNEDTACIRNDNAAENMDILRKWVLNGLQKCKNKPDQSIKSLMRKNLMSFKHLMACVNKILHA